MAWKNADDRREYDRQWSKTNRASRKQANDRWRESRVSWLRDLKRGLKCSRCGENHPATLQFHHRDPSVKEAEIGNMARQWSAERLLSEIEKCEVLCANCHAKEHFTEVQ
jgi:hypothetical protein